MEEFNIIDAYLKYNNMYVIIISGLSGSNKSKIAQNLAKDLKFNYINTRDYIDMDKMDEIELPNGTKISQYNTYKWDEIIKEINKVKEKGVIVCGEYFPKDDLKDLYVDIHIHIKLSKQNIIKKRLEYIESLSDEEKKKYKDNDTETLNINMNVYPYYLDMISKSHINKFINMNDSIDLKQDEFINMASNKIFDEIIQHTIGILKNKNLDKYIVY